MPSYFSRGPKKYGKPAVAKRSFTKRSYPRGTRFAIAAKDTLNTSGNVIQTWQRNKLLYMSAMPPTTFTRHRYCSRITLTGGLGGITGSPHVFRLNGMFDPDITLVGHQPLYYDQMAALYATYCVYKVSIQLQVYGSATATNAIAWRLGSSNDPFTFAGLLWEDFNENPNCGSVPLAIYNGGNNVNTIEIGTYTIAELDGVKMQKVLQDDLYSAQTSANPANGPMLQLGITDLQLNNNPACFALVTLVFHARWTDRKSQNQS